MDAALEARGRSESLGRRAGCIATVVHDSGVWWSHVEMGTGRVCIEVRLRNVGMLSVAAGHVAIFSLAGLKITGTGYCVLAIRLPSVILLYSRATDTTES